MTKIKTWIEGNFALLLLLGAALGFFIPGFGSFSEAIVIVLVASLVYFACPDIRREELFQVDIFQVGFFTLLRFAVFPLFLFYTANIFIPDYAEGILLLALMPAAIAIASLCSISGGKVALGIGLTMISSLLAPAFIPSIFSFLGHLVEVNVLGLFITLTLVVFVPMVLYFVLTRPVKPLQVWVEDKGKAASIITMALVLLVVISSYKDQFWHDLPHLYEGFFIMMGLFFLFYLFGVLFSYFVPKDQRSTYIYASGAINNGLAIGLSFLYFSAETTFFIVLSEIIWCFYVAAAQWYFSRYPET